MICRTRFILICFILVLAGARLYGFDHSYTEYDKVLKTYVKNGLVEYSGLKKDRAALDAWMKEVKAVTASDYESWSRQQQLAYWINVYNGWFLQIVIDRYPIHGTKVLGMSYPQNSVQRIPGIWDNVKINAAGRELSLNIIEHRILRPFFHDPRIHFALVCASLGCPQLRSEAYLPDSVDAQLEDAARAFVNNPSKIRWDDSAKTLSISRIFDWFWDDFESAADDSWRKLYSKKQAGAVAFISHYLPADVAGKLRTSKAKIAYLNYDWTLNDAK